MSRSTSEWNPSSDDAAIPARIKDSIARKANDRCQQCTREVGGKLKAEYDHIIPLILGGAHRESNLQLLCHECHSAKTKLDVKIKAKVARVRKKMVLGLKPKFSRPIPGSKRSGMRKRFNGQVERW